RRVRRRRVRRGTGSPRRGPASEARRPRALRHPRDAARRQDMRFLPTTVHGVLDYLYGAAAIAAPWVLGFARGGAETYVPIALGAAYIAVSLFTDYELGVIRVVPLPTHLAIDGLGGTFLAASPWLL